MARGARTHDYEEEDDMYSGKRDPYRARPRRSHDRHYVKERDYVRRHSIPPPIERMERLRVRDHPRPETTRDDLDDGLVGTTSEVDDIEIPPDDLLSELESPRGSGRRHYSRRPPRVAVPEEELAPLEDSAGRLTDSGSEREAHSGRRDVYTQRRRRARVPKHEADEIYSAGDEMTPEGHRRARSGIRYPPILRRRPSPGYHTDLEDEDDGIVFPPSQRTIVKERADLWPGDNRTFEDIDSPESKSRRSRRPAERSRDRFEPRSQGELSSPESEDSAELPGAPMAPMPPGRISQHLRVPEAFTAPRPPRAPSPEVSFEAPRILHRKEREERKREILVEPRDATGNPPPIRDLPHDIPSRRMKERNPIPRSRAGSPNHRPETMTRELRHSDPSLAEIISDGIPGKEAADHWAIVNAAPKSESSRDGSTGQDVPPSRHRDRKTKFTASDERHSGDDTDYGRARVARRYVGVKEKKERLWTEITKDLVVKEAIERMGYEYEETVTSYFVFSYLQYDDVSALVELSEDIRAARRRRIHELDRRRGSVPSAMAPRDEPLSMEPSRRRHRDGRRAKDRGVGDDSRGRPPSERW